MAAQQQLEQELQGLLQACQAAPRYGANGRFLILQAARNIEEYEAEHGVAAVAWPPQGKGALQPPSAAAVPAALLSAHVHQLHRRHHHMLDDMLAVILAVICSRLLHCMSHVAVCCARRCT
jgi:hypothetical protein